MTNFNIKFIKQNQMHKPLTKQQIIQQSKIFYNTIINKVSLTPVLLNVSLISNPFIKDKDSYKYLKHQLNQYNKRIHKNEVTDQYEIVSFNQLHSMVSDLAQIDSKDSQLAVLEEITKWFKEQSRLIKQRSSQGQVRHQITKSYRQFTRNIQETNQQTVQDQYKIPFYIIQQKLAPYRNNNRTLHKQQQSPTKLLANYKRKIVQIVSPPQTKQEQTKHIRALYPVPPKYQPAKDQIGQLIAQPIEGQVPNSTIEGQPSTMLPQGQPSQLNPQISQVQSLQPDMGGFGQEPQQPQQEQPPEQVPDKLKPKNPLYIHAISTDQQPKYKQSYLFHLGNDNQHQRNMEIRTVRKYHYDLRQQKEETIQVEMAHEWARRKSKMAKDIQKRLQQMKLKASYTISNQPCPSQQKLSYNDQLKYGFTTIVKQKPKTKQYDLSYNQLPKIGKYALDEKTIRSDRLSSLKNKFAKILNLVEQQQSRKPVQSMCQITQRRHRGISQIMKNHSQQKERLDQIEQVSKLKEKLSRAKVNINYTSLSRGLCLPENEQSIDEGQMKFPSKDLPSNPNLIETKKKKKKK